MSKYDRPIRSESEVCQETYVQKSRVGSMTHVCIRDKDHTGNHVCGNCYQEWLNVDAPTSSYWASELDKVIGDDYDVVRVQFRGKTETKWLSLTQKQFEQIKGFLLSIEEGLI